MAKKKKVPFPSGLFVLLMLTPLLATLGLATESEDTPSPRQRVSQLADKYVELYFAYQPELQTSYRLANAEHDKLNPTSLDELGGWQAEEDALWNEVKDIDVSVLYGTPEWITFAYLKESLEASRAKRVCRMELWPVSHLTGWQVSYPQLADEQPVETDAQRAAAIKRWQSLGKWVDTEIENLKMGLKLGYSSPQRIVDAVLEQVDNLLDISVEESPFSAPVKKNVPETFKTQWMSLVSDEIYPALRRYRLFLHDEYRPAARTELAITAHPSGEACYRASYRSFTTLDRSAKEVFTIGLKAVEANEQKLIELGNKAFGTSDPVAIRQHIKNDPQNRFSTKEEIIKQAEDMVTRAKAVSRDWFGKFPKGKMVVEPVPSYKEKMVTASYDMAPEDGSRPAKYWINLYQPEQQQRGSGEVTAIHEAYPGHHMQIALSNERTGMHRITQVVTYSGFTEGWARYSEALADEMDLYQTDYARIGRLSWPARGMVADAAIHGMGWTNQQAMDFMDAAGTLSPGMSEKLLNRIAVWPGQLAAYDSGGLDILALRRFAKEALGDRFDIRQFHDRVLESGSVPLPLLREKIERWVKTQLQ